MILNGRMADSVLARLPFQERVAVIRVLPPTRLQLSEAVKYPYDLALNLKRRNRDAQLGEVVAGEAFRRGARHVLHLLIVEGGGLKLVGHELRVHGVPNRKAIVVNG